MTLDGTVVEVNRFSLDASGFRREEVLGKKFWECGWWSKSAELIDLVRGGVAEAVAGRVFHVETPYFVADGSQRIVEMTISPVTDDRGHVLFVAPTGIDVSDRKQAEKDLRRLADDLAAANRNKTEFLAVLGHELRNPLAPIRTGIELLRRIPRTDTRVDDITEMMARQVAHLVRLIDDLLDVSRITSGKVTLKKELITLGAVIEAALETTLPGIQAEAHQFTVSVRDGGTMLYADLDRLSQVIANLLNNAAKYTPREGHLQLVAWRDGEQALITVTDNGAGISEAHLSKIFDLFVQEDRNRDRSQDGLGIGLSLVQSLVELHGGVVTAASDGAGKGSTFLVKLPIQPSPHEIRAGLADIADAPRSVARL